MTHHCCPSLLLGLNQKPENKNAGGCPHRRQGPRARSRVGKVEAGLKGRQKSRGRGALRLQSRWKRPRPRLGGWSNLHSGLQRARALRAFAHSSLLAEPVVKLWVPKNQIHQRKTALTLSGIEHVFLSVSYFSH